MPKPSTKDLRIAVDPAQLEELKRDPDKMAELVRMATDFRAFLKHWRFVDGETGVVKNMGEELWEGQEILVDEMVSTAKIYALKARKLGFTTLAIAFDAWVLRFRAPNERVHLFSRRDDAAQELLKAVTFGLKRLPEWARLPVAKDTSSEFHLNAGEDDVRIAKAYPADEDTAVEATATHAHIDELARMKNPARVYQAIEPTLAGSAHILTTGMGPQNWSAVLWRRCMSGDAAFKAVFVDALKRPDRNETWLKAKRKSMTEEQFRREYAMSWKDALFGGGDFAFDSAALDKASQGAIGPQEPDLGYKAENEGEEDRPGRRYVKAWDIGRHKDAAVGIVLDVTDDVEQVVAYVRLREKTYPFIQTQIESMHNSYPGLTMIEDNAAGEAVRENLDLPPRQVEGFKTTVGSKARIIAGLEVAFQNGDLKYDAASHEVLDAELRAYQVPDKHVVQDSVMALAIAHDSAHKRVRKGRVSRVLRWG